MMTTYSGVRSRKHCPKEGPREPRLGATTSAWGIQGRLPGEGDIRVRLCRGP